MKSHTVKYKTILVPIITKHLPGAEIILYGSRARGDEREGSDIDIVDFHVVFQKMQQEILKEG